MWKWIWLKFHILCVAQSCCDVEWGSRRASSARSPLCCSLLLPARAMQSMCRHHRSIAAHSFLLHSSASHTFVLKKYCSCTPNQGVSPQLVLAWTQQGSFLCIFWPIPVTVFSLQIKGEKSKTTGDCACSNKAALMTKWCIIVLWNWSRCQQGRWHVERVRV